MQKQQILHVEYRDGGLWLQLDSRATARRIALETSAKMHTGKQYDIEIKRHRERRSSDVAAY